MRSTKFKEGKTFHAEHQGQRGTHTMEGHNNQQPGRNGGNKEERMGKWKLDEEKQATKQRMTTTI
jgi:hypothetical protein